MELKVWVDGIQRVVCGVTDSSTCQDVVYALAHATGQTGRFTLVEKWRNSERLLAPYEQPLKVLMKWGEYANDVHFVMRRSTETNPKSQANSQFTQNNKRQHDFLHNFSPTSTNANQKLVVSKEIKKSLTFSCGHGSSGSVSSESSNQVVSNNNASVKAEPPPPPPPSQCMKSRDSKSRQDLPKGVVRGIPQKPKDSDNGNCSLARPKHPPPYDEAVSRSSGRFAPSQLSVSSTTIQLSQDEESPSSKRRHLAIKNEQHELGSDQQQNHHKQITPTTKPIVTDSPERTVIRATTNITEKEKSPSKLSSKKSVSSQSIVLEDIQNTKSKRNLIGRLENEKKIVSDSLNPATSSKVNIAKTENSNCDPQCQDLMRLVSLQKEKLENQQAEISQFDAEIIYWENQLQEQEQKLRILQEEVAHLDRTQQAQEGELSELERRPFNEEVELGRQEERTLRSELTLARSQIANCETELLQCHQRIRLLLEEISNERHHQSLRDEQEKKELEEQEQRLQEQLENIQQQLKDKTNENSNQKTTVELVKGELKEVDSKICEKQKEVERLMEEIRDANLYSLSLIPTEDSKSVTEGGNFYNRAGSTRKIIGSPRQLENAVPTNKNPHGVWV